MRTLALLLATLALGDGGAAEPGAEAELWAGHQILRGKRHIPVLGDEDTQTESFVLTEIRRAEGRLEMRERTCRVDIKPILGMTPTLKPSTLARMPEGRFTVQVNPDGTVRIAPWTVTWPASDLDGDGFPGTTVEVKGGLCSGAVYVSSVVHTSVSSARLTEQGLVGEMSVRMVQTVLGARGLCLRLTAGDSDDTERGSFSYRRVPAGTTCQSLAGKPWPVDGRLSR
jgi:hypothetical protein